MNYAKLFPKSQCIAEPRPPTSRDSLKPPQSVLSLDVNVAGWSITRFYGITPYGSLLINLCYFIFVSLIWQPKCNILKNEYSMTGSYDYVRKNLYFIKYIKVVMMTIRWRPRTYFILIWIEDLWRLWILRVVLPIRVLPGKGFIQVLASHIWYAISEHHQTADLRCPYVAKKISLSSSPTGSCYKMSWMEMTQVKHQWMVVWFSSDRKIIWDRGFAGLMSYRITVVCMVYQHE